MDLEGSARLPRGEQAAGSVREFSVILLANGTFQSEREGCMVSGMTWELFFLGIKAPGTAFSP